MSVCVSCDGEFVIIVFKTMHDVISASTSASADNTYLDPDYSWYQNNLI